MPLEEALEDQNQILDFEPDEGFVDDYVQDFSGDTEQIYSDDNEDVELKSNVDSLRTRQKQENIIALSRKKAAYLEESKDKNTNSEEYFDEFKQKDAPKSDEIVQDREIKSYLKALLDKHAIKENVRSEDRRLKVKDENNARQLIRNQNKNIRKQIQDKDLYDKKYEENLVDFSKNTLNSKELNEISDYMAPRPESMEITKSQTNDGDIYQDSDIKFDNDFLEDNNIKADKNPNEHMEVEFGK